MPDIESSYMLKRFTSSSDLDFSAALLLYVRNTEPNIRTDTNEITHWLDRFSKQFEDEFYVFGFYHNRQLVGYAEAAYFRQERLFALDYLVVDESARRSGVFNEFVDSLRFFLEDAHPEYRYGFAEVAYGSDELKPSQESALKIRLLKMQGFRVIKAPYYQPRLMHDDAESEMRAELLIYSASQLERIRTETYLRIVRTIYYKYYLRWKSFLPASGEEYKTHLDLLFARIQSKVEKRQSIEINGHRAILKPVAKKPVITVHKLVGFSAQALIVIVLLTASMLGLRLAFNINASLFVTIYGLALLSFFAVAGIVSKDARAIFGELVSLVKYISDRKLGGSKQIDLDKEPVSPHDPGER
jgi:hypothetical protein